MTLLFFQNYANKNDADSCYAIAETTFQLHERHPYSLLEEFSIEESLTTLRGRQLQYNATSSTPSLRAKWQNRSAQHRWQEVVYKFEEDVYEFEHRASS